MTKHQKYYQEMIDANREIFDRFSRVHEKYILSPKESEAEFNHVGEEVMDVIRTYEGRLCHHSESSQYGKFSGTLADRFWEEIRKDFPNIDMVGVKSS